MSRRGDVVVVEIPYYDRPGGKERPAVVVQCDRNNARLLSAEHTGRRRNYKLTARQHGANPVPRRSEDVGGSILRVVGALGCKVRESLYGVADAHQKDTRSTLLDSPA